MLDEPRELLDRALLPLYPPELPPNALLFLPELGETLRLPMLLLPPAERLLAPAPPRLELPTLPP